MSQKHQKTLIVLLLILIPWGLFYKVGSHDFISMDDPFFIESHGVPDGLTLDNIKNAFLMDDCLWMPLTWISHMADIQVYGMDAGGHHYTSLAIHIIACVLLFLLLFRMTGQLWPSGLAAALLALHPINVEAVAYLSARKGLLSALFWILATLCYNTYTRDKAWRYYTLAILFFIGGAMSKPSIVMLPAALLILDYWPLARFGNHSTRWLIIEKIPFFLLAAVTSVVAVMTQHKAGTVLSLEAAPFALRLENALVSYVLYLWKTIWPLKLAIFYPYPRSFLIWQPLGAGALLAGITAAALYFRRRAPYLLAGWLWFLLTLLPAIGIIKTGQQAMADRYAYIPLLGIFIMAAWGISAINEKPAGKRSYIYVLPMVLLAILAGLTYRQARFWQNSRSAFAHAVKVTSNNYLAYNNLGEALAREGLPAEAYHAFSRALEIVPELPQSNLNLGLLLMQRQQPAKAIPYLERAIQADPNYIDAHYALARAYLETNDPAKADIHFQKVLTAKADTVYLAQSHVARGNFLAGQQKIDQARHHFEEALKLEPDMGEAHNGLGQILLGQGEKEAAALHFQQALTVCPGRLDPANYLADIYKQSGEYEKALALYQHLREIRPDCSTTLDYNIAAMYARTGDRDEALKWLKKSIAGGFNQVDILLRDEDFAGLRNTAEFKSLAAALAR